MKKTWLKYWQKISRHPVFVKSLIIVGAILAALILIVFSFNVSYGQRVFPKTFIGNINVGNKTLAEAKNILADSIKQTGDKEVALTFQDKTWRIKNSDIDLSYDSQKSAELAWAVGRQGSLAKIIQEQFWAAFSSNQYPAVFKLDQNKLNNYLVEFAKETDRAQKDATITITEAKPAIEPEIIGRQLDLTKNSKMVLGLFGELVPVSRHALIVNDIQPKITQADAQNAYQETIKILGGEVVLKTDKKDFTLKSVDIAPWLEFNAVQANILSQNRVLAVAIKEDALKNYLDDLAKEIDQAPRDAKFQMQNGRAMVFQTSQTGYELDREQAAKIIGEGILNHVPSIELLVKVTEPEVSASSAATYGIKELVAEGVTSWRGSPKNRIHNLTLGSKNISGTVVKPGEEFSTVKSIGVIDLDHGFLPELVIKNGTQVVPDIGGGLCQVSTTLFRAALNAGMKITERTNHSFRVSYYEPPVGMDATIYDPKPDFRFINNMKTPILIWATPTDNGLSFQIYGTKDNRQVEVTTPVTFDYIDPPAPIYTETDTMDPGAIRQVERATRGVTATFHYKVTAAKGEILQNQTFVSKYIPIPDTFLYGPGADVPAPAPAP